jgi:hypothetical protein
LFRLLLFICITVYERIFLCCLLWLFDCLCRHVFVSNIFQEVAYNMLLTDQRKELHKATSKYYEGIHCLFLFLYFQVYTILCFNLILCLVFIFTF